jgi:hypothetical protein
VKMYMWVVQIWPGILNHSVSLNRLTCFILCSYGTLPWSRISSGSIVSDYWLDDRAIGVRSPVGTKDFSSSLCVQTGSGAHPASCTMGTGDPFPGGKSAAGAWRWSLTHLTRGREWVGAIPPLPPSASMACSGTALLLPLWYSPLHVCMCLWLYTHISVSPFMPGNIVENYCFYC